MKIIFLCTGNLNRSAAAHAVAAYCGFAAVASAGTSRNARHRSPMAKRTRVPLLAAGVPAKFIERHRSQYAGDVTFAPEDVVVGFQPSHRQWVEANAPQCKYVSFASRCSRADWSNKIPDPGFNANIAGEVVDEIVRTTPGLCKELLSCVA